MYLPIQCHYPLRIRHHEVFIFLKKLNFNDNVSTLRRLLQIPFAVESLIHLPHLAQFQQSRFNDQWDSTFTDVVLRLVFMDHQLYLISIALSKFRTGRTTWKILFFNTPLDLVILISNHMNCILDSLFVLAIGMAILLALLLMLIHFIIAAVLLIYSA